VKYKQIYDGDTVLVSGLVCCCHCGLTHKYVALPKKRGEKAKMKIFTHYRATAARRRWNRDKYRKRLRVEGLL